MKTHLLFLFIPAFLLVSCTKETPLQTDKVVVEAFLFAGQKIDDVRLTTIVPFGGNDTISKPINNADVFIYWQNKAYKLQNTNDSGYYHYPGNDLTIKTGELYEIKFNYNGFDVYAQTVCPPPPANISITKDTMKVVYFSLIDSILNGGSIEIPEPDSVIINWPNPNQAYYYVVAENVESVKESIYPDFISGVTGFFFQTMPTTNNSYTFFDLDFKHFGRHEIRVYKVNDEYVNLFTSFNQDSRTQAEPLTNVVNGLGVFTAVNFSTINLYVTK